MCDIVWIFVSLLVSGFIISLVAISVQPHTS